MGPCLLSSDRHHQLPPCDQAAWQGGANKRKCHGGENPVAEINKWLGSGHRRRPPARDPGTSPAVTADETEPGGRGAVIGGLSAMYGPEHRTNADAPAVVTITTSPNPLPALTQVEVLGRNGNSSLRSQAARPVSHPVHCTSVPTLGEGAVCHANAPNWWLPGASEIQSYRLCYPRMAGASLHGGVSYCPHTAAVISMLCSAVLPGHIAMLVAPHIVQLLAPHQYPETPPPHYPAKPLVPLKICSLNKHLQHGAGAPLVRLLQEFNFLLSRFYNELCTVATSRGLPSVQSLRSLGSRARARMDSAIQRRQTLSQVLQPGHITVMLPARPAIRVVGPTPLHPSHPLSLHLRAITSPGGSTPEFVSKFGVSLASASSALSEPPPYRPTSEDGAGAGGQTTNTGCATYKNGFHLASSPAYSDALNERCPAPDAVLRGTSA